MGIYIKGMEMPKDYGRCMVIFPDGRVTTEFGSQIIAKAVYVPPHGRLIDADAMRAAMYHEAFETDSPLQKWDGGCWIRYKMFERMESSAPTIIPAATCDPDD